MGLTTALMAVGTGLNVAGSLASGSANARTLTYQSQIANYNADLAAARGESAATQSQMRSAANVGAIKAGFGASGIDVNSGSAAKVASAAESLGALDALTIRSDAAREAFGYRTRANALKQEASTARTSAWLDAAGSLLGGLTKISGKLGKEEILGDNSNSTLPWSEASWAT